MGFSGKMFEALQWEVLEKEDSLIFIRDAWKGGKGITASFGSGKDKQSKGKNK